jgi:hypothetical protein
MPALHHFRLVIIAAMLLGVLPFIILPTSIASAQESVKVFNVTSNEASQGIKPQPDARQNNTAPGNRRAGTFDKRFGNVFPNISNNDITINEESVGQVTATFTVRLSAPTTDQVTVDYATGDDTATGGLDYTPRNGTLTFAPRQITQTIFIPITGDTLDETNETFFVFLFNAVNANFSDNLAIGTILDNDPDPGTSGEMLISEFRTSGPAGANDEFIELYNNTNAPIDIRNYNINFISSDGLSTSVSFATVQGALATLAPRGHLILANLDGYSLTSYAAPGFGFRDANFSFANNTGFLLRRNGSGAMVDAVGFTSDATTYREGAGLPVIAPFPTPTPEYSYVRRMTIAGEQDSNDNAADFTLVSTTGEVLAGVSSVLGAPGPQNQASPVLHNDVNVSFIDPGSPRLAPPNFVRTGSGNSGTLSIRRHFTNNTGATLTRLRFRVIDITTLNTPNPGGAQADLRLVNSNDEQVSTSLGQTITVKGTTLDEPPAQPNGGGINSSIRVALPSGGLSSLSNGICPTGQVCEIDTQFLLNVVQIGRFRFFVNVEALP